MIRQIDIDVSSVLRRAVCDLFSNLVTRPTGAAVRTEIELLLSDVGPSAGARPSIGTLTVIDFTHVNLLDFSCADEVVAKLLLRFAEAPSTARPAYFLFRGVRDEHLEAIESVLGTYGLALVALAADGQALLVGSVDEGERAAWSAVHRLGRADINELALEIGGDAVALAVVLETLHSRRLVMRLDEDYVALGELT